MSRTRATPWLSALILCSGCVGVDDLREGDLDVPPSVILSTGDSEDPDNDGLDGPLNEILASRVEGGFSAIDNDRVLSAVRAQARRRSQSSIPWLESLILDPIPEIQIQALAALEAVHATGSLPIIADAAMNASLSNTREQAYHTFTVLSGVAVNFPDERRLMMVLEARGEGE